MVLAGSADVGVVDPGVLAQQRDQRFVGLVAIVAAIRGHHEPDILVLAHSRCIHDQRDQILRQHLWGAPQCQKHQQAEAANIDGDMVRRQPHLRYDRIDRCCFSPARRFYAADDAASPYS